MLVQADYSQQPLLHHKLLEQMNANELLLTRNPESNTTQL
jgi:hypothetical protein